MDGRLTGLGRVGERVGEALSVREMQGVKNKSWRKEELRCVEGGLPRQGTSTQQQGVTRLRRVWAVIGSILRSSGHVKRNQKRKCEILEAVWGGWPQQACTTIFFLISMKVASERPIALFDQMVGVVGCARGVRMARRASCQVRRH